MRGIQQKSNVSKFHAAIKVIGGCRLPPRQRLHSEVFSILFP